MKVLGFAAAPSRATRVVWALEEAEADYEYQGIDPRAGDLSTDWFRALNPGGKVPVLVDDDFVVTESVAILSYIADRFPEKGLAPEPRTRARATYDQWCAFVTTELEQALWSIGKHRFALPRDWRVPGMLETAPKEFARAAKVLAGALADREWLVGDRFTMADLLAGHTLVWARSFGLPLGHDVLGVYCDRAASRPAFARAVARSQT